MTNHHPLCPTMLSQFPAGSTCGGCEGIRIAIEAECEACAMLVSRWHIKRGGYTEMAYQIRDRK